MLDLLWSALAIVGAIVLVVLIVVVWTALERIRSPRRTDNESTSHAPGHEPRDDLDSEGHPPIGE